MAEDEKKKIPCEKGKLMDDVVEKLEELMNASERIRLPEDLRKDLIMLFKRLLCKLKLGSLEAEDIISDVCSLEKCIKMNNEEALRKMTSELIEKYNRSSSCTIQGDHCVRATREEMRTIKE
nr:uncharacterized protein LOC106677139 [Halyomorpha halys]